MTAQLSGGNPVLPQNGILVFPPVGGCRGVPVFLYEAPSSEYTKHPRPSIRSTLVRVYEAPSSEYTKYPRPSMRSTLVWVCEALALIIFI
ncbi:hypothetical protein [Bacteroides fragilis]|uniref:hypothetical protein n=1 Tax=Bacteroides fragilis TaxID=817 RepID=UPI002030DB59|nr:hypothetical protein [Bacteroides fragilis]MCM0273707.1 hypothetical protein [Bacteroides fragilis]